MIFSQRQIIQELESLSQPLKEVEKNIEIVNKSVYRLNIKIMKYIKSGQIGVFSSDIENFHSIFTESIQEILDDKEAKFNK